MNYGSGRFVSYFFATKRHPANPVYIFCDEKRKKILQQLIL
jgi:hypothetical protein